MSGLFSGPNATNPLFDAVNCAISKTNGASLIVAGLF